MSRPTKADPLYERMLHAFGEQRIRRSFENMVSFYGKNLLDCLTDEARAELIMRCIVSHKLHRRFAVESRRAYALSIEDRAHLEVTGHLPEDF